MEILNLYYCSFCRKVPTSEGVDFIIAGPEGINICEKCIDLCTEILKEKREEQIKTGTEQVQT